MIPTKTLLCFLLFCMLSNTSCLVYQEKNLEEITLESPAYLPKKPLKVFYQWSLQSEWWMVPEQNHAGTIAFHGRLFAEALSSTRCCLLVETAEEADLVVDGRTFGKFNYAERMAGELSSRSLFIVPFLMIDETRIVVSVTRGDDKHSYELQDSSTILFWLPLILGYPFMEDPTTQVRAVPVNTYKHLILRMRKDGLLD